VGRRLADDLPERADEGPSAGEADVEADVGDAPVSLAQQEHRALHPPPLKVTVRRFPEDGSEAANEVRFGDTGHRRYCADIERLGVGAVHRVAGAQQAPVQVLDFPAHGQTLRHQGACAQPASFTTLALFDAWMRAAVIALATNRPYAATGMPRRSTRSS